MLPRRPTDGVAAVYRNGALAPADQSLPAPSALPAAPVAVVNTASALASYGYTQAQADAIVAQLNLVIARNLAIELILKNAGLSG